MPSLFSFIHFEAVWLWHSGIYRFLRMSRQQAGRFFLKARNKKPMLPTGIDWAPDHENAIAFQFYPFWSGLTLTLRDLSLFTHVEAASGKIFFLKARNKKPMLPTGIDWAPDHENAIAFQFYPFWSGLTLDTPGFIAFYACRGSKREDFFLKARNKKPMLPTGIDWAPDHENAIAFQFYPFWSGLTLTLRDLSLFTHVEAASGKIFSEGPE